MVNSYQLSWTGKHLTTGPMIPNPDVFKSFPASSNEGLNTFFEASAVSEEPSPQPMI